MAHEKDVAAPEMKCGDPFWDDLVKMAEEFAGSLMVCNSPYRTMTRDHPNWHDAVNEFIVHAAKIVGEDDPKEAEALQARRFDAGSKAANRFYYNQVRKRQKHEHSLSSAKAQAILGIPSWDGDEGGHEGGAEPADNDYVQPMDRMIRDEMLATIRRVVNNLPLSQRSAFRMHSGLGEIPELDGFEPRKPNKDGSGGARGLRAVEIAPALKVTDRQVRYYLQAARSAIREALEEEGYDDEDFHKYLGFYLED